MSNHNYKPYLIFVDDEPHFSESLQMAIEDTFKVSTAPSLGSARELLKEKIPDAVLLDMKLPDGNGIDFLREIGRASCRERV